MKYPEYNLRLSILEVHTVSYALSESLENNSVHQTRTGTMPTYDEYVRTAFMKVMKIIHFEEARRLGLKTDLSKAEQMKMAVHEPTELVAKWEAILTEKSS